MFQLMEGLVSFMASNHGTFLATLMASDNVDAELERQGAPRAFIKTFRVRFSAKRCAAARHMQSAVPLEALFAHQRMLDGAPWTQLPCPCRTGLTKAVF